MAIRQFKKDLNKSNNLPSVPKTNKSFVNEREFKSFYRMRNGERVKYLEKSALEAIEKMMCGDEEISDIKIEFEDIKNTITDKIESNTDCAVERYQEYMRFSSIASKLNIPDLCVSLNTCAMANRDIAHRNIDMYQMFFCENVTKSESFEDILTNEIEERTGLLQELIEGLGKSIPKEISSLYRYREIAKLAKEIGFNQIVTNCLQICDTKKVIIEQLSIALNELLEKIEEHKMKFSIIQTSEKSKVTPPVKENNKEKGGRTDA